MLLLLAVGLFVAGPSKGSAAAQPAPATGRFISVTGESFVALKPEMVRLRVLAPIESNGGPNSLAPIDRVTGALRSNGVSREDIHIQGPTLALLPLDGMTGSAMVVDATLRDPSRLADAVRAVVAQGGRLTGARFMVAKPDQAQNQAINQALKDALAKAKVLASAASGSVGQVHSMTAERVAEEGASPGASALTEGSQVSIPAFAAASYGFRARVQVSYELR
ncbi:MAG: SIMPL domain-containing protein [Symbiobacteriia bacterium]